MNTILEAIKANINPTDKKMTTIGLIKGGDGTSTFNKGNGKKKNEGKVTMLESLGFTNSDITTESKKTLFVGSNYQTMQNNRITKALTNLAIEMECTDGNSVALGIVNNILDESSKGEYFKAQPLPWGEWVEGFNGILIENKGELYLRGYDETKNKTKISFFAPNGTEIDVNDSIYAQFKKPSKPKSGKVNELRETLAKIVGVNDSLINEALDALTPIKPQNIKLSNIKILNIKGLSIKA